MKPELSIELCNLTCREIQTHLARMDIHVSLKTVHRWANDGCLGEATGYHHQGRAYPREDIEAFLAVKIPLLLKRQ